MSDLLNQLHDDELDFTVTITDTDGVTAKYEFLDIVFLDKIEYAVVAPLDSDGYVDIFRVQKLAEKEFYIRETDDKTLDRVFEVFRMKNEDEFDFE